jgi:NDP-sugar pyrophosphorylase family protein
LRPLTELRPKALCPVGNVTLLDLALARVTSLGLSGPADVAVNAHHHAGQIVDAVGDRAHPSIEQPEALGTAGAIAQLKPWIAGRDVLVLNADAYLSGPTPADFLQSWSADSPRLLVVPAGDRRKDFADRRFAGVSLLPAATAAKLRPEPTGLYEVVWRDAWQAGQLELTPFNGVFVDCGTPADYLAANLDAAEPGNLIAPGAKITGTVSQSVVGPGAVVEGRLERSVVWPGVRVGAEEALVDAVRAADGVTVGTKVSPSDFSPRSAP